MKNNWSPKIKLNSSGVAVMQSKAGTYRLLYVSPKTNRCRTFYIGETNNLRSEIASHLPWRERNKELAFYLKNYKCFFQVSETVTETVQEIKPRPSFFRFLKAFTSNSASAVYYK